MRIWRRKEIWLRCLIVSWTCGFSISGLCITEYLTHPRLWKTKTKTTRSKRQADTKLLEVEFRGRLDVSTFYESLGAQSGYQTSFSTDGWSGNKVSHNRKRNQTNNVNKLGETSQMSRQVHNNNFSSNLVSIFSFQIFNFGKTNYLESGSINLTPSRGFVLFLFTLCSFSIQENKLLKPKCWQPYNP